MTKKEYIARNISMTFDFIRHLINHPDVIAMIQDGAEIDFIEKDIPFKMKSSIKGKRIVRYKVKHIFEPIKG